METLSHVNGLGILSYKHLRHHRLEFVVPNLFREPIKAEPSENFIEKRKEALGSMLLIYEAFWDTEGRLSQPIPGISLPSVDSKSSNIYNFRTAYISTEDCLCAI
jgi:hypothetical protein